MKTFILLFILFTSVFSNSFDFENYFFNNPNKMLLINPENGKILRVNNEASKFYGYTIDKLESMNINEINTFTKEQTINEINLAKSEKRNYFIFRHRLKNGELKHVEVATLPINYNGKKVLLSTIYINKIMTNKDNTLSHYSKNLEERLDIEIQNHLSHEKDIRNILILAFIAQLLIILFLIKNNREKNRIKEELLEKNKDLEDTYRLFDIGKIIAFKWKNDESWTVEYVSNGVDNILEYTKDEFLKQKVLYSNIIHKDDIQRVIAEVKKSLQNKRKEFSHEPYRIITKSGETKWILDYTIIIRDKNDDITNFLGYILDITDLKNKETELTDIKNRYKLAIDGANDGLWDWNVKTNDVYFSPRWKTMLGYEDNEVSNNLDEWVNRVHPDDIEQAFADVHAHFDGLSEVYINEHRMKHKDGSWIWILDRGKVLRDEENNPSRMVGFHSDITKNKLYEKELHNLVEAKTEENVKQFNLLQQQSKLAAMGEMIAAIAHQWRQPLNTLALRVQLIEEDFDDKLVDKKYLQEFNKESMDLINFMSKTIDDFRQFYKKDKQMVVFDVRSIILEITGMLATQMEKNYITLIIEDDSFTVNTLKSEFQQVILNLINNSIDAIVSNKIKNGQINIEIKRLSKDEGIISVLDNAGEIPADIKTRVFEPYFTTKDEGKGTGLSLYMSKVIIENNMNGKIYLEECEETKFSIKLDVSKDK